MLKKNNYLLKMSEYWLRMYLVMYQCDLVSGSIQDKLSSDSVVLWAAVVKEGVG